MRPATWLLVNGLRWLVVLAVLAWINPQPLRLNDARHIPTVEPIIVHVMQLTPCSPWAMQTGRWYGAYCCAVEPSAEQLYKTTRARRQ